MNKTLLGPITGMIEIIFIYGDFKSFLFAIPWTSLLEKEYDNIFTHCSGVFFEKNPYFSLKYGRSIREFLANQVLLFTKNNGFRLVEEYVV